jgi:hypothetical protein
MPISFQRTSIPRPGIILASELQTFARLWYLDFFHPLFVPHSNTLSRKLVAHPRRIFASLSTGLRSLAMLKRSSRVSYAHLVSHASWTHQTMGIASFGHQPRYGRPVSSRSSPTCGVHRYPRQVAFILSRRVCPSSDDKHKG